MFAYKKFITFCNDNVVMIAGISIIVGVHWGWYKLQSVPALVDPAEKKELPIIIGAKYLGRLATDKYNELVKGEPPEVTAADK